MDQREELNGFGEDGYSITVGPLTMDSRAMRAYTVFHTELSLSKEEFDTLYILAAREGEALTLETLYNAVWRGKDGAGRNAAVEGIMNVTEQVNAAGRGFMWIDFSPDKGYAFGSRWGHNWQTRTDGTTTPDGGGQQARLERRRSMRNRVWAATVSTGVCAAAIALALITGAAPQTDNPPDSPQVTDDDYVIIEDTRIPLDAAPSPRDVVFPEIGDITARSGEDIVFRNPEDSGCTFEFVVILADTGEILFESGPVGPGENAVMTPAIPPGEYAAELMIRAVYEITGADERARTGFILTIT